MKIGHWAGAFGNDVNENEGILLAPCPACDASVWKSQVQESKLHHHEVLLLVRDLVVHHLLARRATSKK